MPSDRVQLPVESLGSAARAADSRFAPVGDRYAYPLVDSFSSNFRMKSCASSQLTRTIGHLGRQCADEEGG